MPHKNDLNRLYHIWEATREALAFTQDRVRADLDADRLLQHGLVHLLEIIGEAAGSISPEFIATYPHIPWRVMVGMRNRLIRAYFDINLDVVWKTVTTDLPALDEQVTPILVNAGMLPLEK